MFRSSSVIVEKPVFAGKYGGGGNRTRVGVTPETVVLQELSWATTQGWEERHDWTLELAEAVHVQRDWILQGNENGIYVVFDGDAAKIGIGREPHKRAAALQVGNPRQLILYASAPGNAELETLLHELLAKWQIRGEWFAASPETLAVAELIRSCAEICACIEQYGDQAACVEDTVSHLAMDLWREDYARMVAA